jgi:hypothetical protein
MEGRSHPLRVAAKTHAYIELIIIHMFKEKAPRNHGALVTAADKGIANRARYLCTPEAR